MRKPQLSLVDSRVELLAQPQDPVRQVFDHWVLLNDKNPLRCKLAPDRRQVIAAALSVYDIDTVLLAVEGMASAQLSHLPESQQAAMRDLEWFLPRSRFFDRAVELGERVRAQLAAGPVQQPAGAQPRTPEQQAEWEAARQRLLTRVRASRAGGDGGQGAHG